MEEGALRNLYREYLDEVLNIKYKKFDIETVSKRFGSKLYLKPKDCSENFTPIEQFNEITELENGNFLCYSREDDSFVFLSSDGEELNKIKNVNIGKFHENIARITSRERPFLTGYIDINGKMISEMKWGFSSKDFSCGRALVEGTGDAGVLGRYGYIDTNGRIAVPFKSIDAFSFSDDVCCFEMEGRKCFYDKEGKELFKDAFSDTYFYDGLVRFQGINCKYGFKNKNGDVVIKPKFDSVTGFENGIAKSKNGYINLKGHYVRVGSYDDGVKYIKGLLNPVYYNSLRKSYDKMESVPYKDLGNYLLCIRSSKIVIYSKESGIYTDTGINYEHNNISVILKGNLLSINGMIFYLNSNGCINLSSVFDINEVASFEEFPEVMSYEAFVSSTRKDADFVNKAKQISTDIKNKNLQNEINASKSMQDKKRQEIISQLEKLKSALNELDDTAGELSKIDVDLLLKRVDDHLEINPDFIGQLKYLDLSYVDFSNVKVDGLDFSGSNASIDPQTVYNKNMSNGKYDGLSFIAKSFNGVNIRASSFENCNMDFVSMDGAITDDSYDEEDVFIL